MSVKWKGRLLFIDTSRNPPFPQLAQFIKDSSVTLFQDTFFSKLPQGRAPEGLSIWLYFASLWKLDSAWNQDAWGWAAGPGKPLLHTRKGRSNYWEECDKFLKNGFFKIMGYCFLWGFFPLFLAKESPSLSK